MTRRKKFIIGFFVAGVIGIGVLSSQLPNLGAHALIVPFRKDSSAEAPAGIELVTYEGDGVKLSGWRGEAQGEFRGTLIYLHGVSDNRRQGAGILENFRARGFDVISYDSRAHGDSEGEYCTYGVYEKRDLIKVLDTIKPGPVVLLGSSLGGAVALQTAAEDERVSLVIAAESFSDLRTVATERAPFVYGDKSLAEAFEVAEEKAAFSIDEASAVNAASKLEIPVLLIHGEDDTATPPHHSEIIHEALQGKKELIIVPDAKHSEALKGSDVWRAIEEWIDKHLPAQ